MFLSREELEEREPIRAMGASPVSLVILEGTPPGGGSREALVRKARHAAIYDNFAKFMRCSAVGPMILATNDGGLARSMEGLPVTVHPFEVRGEFHFGRLLTEIIEAHGMEKIFYLGGGAGLFLEDGEILTICHALSEGAPMFCTNNFFSSDFVAFFPAQIVQSIRMPRMDNLLAYLLSEEGRLPCRPLPQTLGTLFDIDTPVDVAMLSLYPFSGERVGQAAGSELPVKGTIEKILSLLENKEAELIVAGRINPRTIMELEASAKCRIRFFSEERGMKARGRIERGEVRSLLGSFIEDGGAERFFSAISSVADGAILDSRVLFAHGGRKVAKEDRYLSDLGEYGAIRDDFVREFTFQAGNASMPILLGGHSLITGGLWILAKILREKGKVR
ncbi:MAG: hypothetical protein RDV48_07705 [Candidatus Eremiobacteraeota bacterium]|nr:hypothetical protein [Candidatus Eremiobacteraeota bacterium]